MECSRQSAATWWNQTLQMRAVQTVQTRRQRRGEMERQRQREGCRNTKRQVEAVLQSIWKNETQREKKVIAMRREV